MLTGARDRNAGVDHPVRCSALGLLGGGAVHLLGSAGSRCSLLPRSKNCHSRRILRHFPALVLQLSYSFGSAVYTMENNVWFSAAVIGRGILSVALVAAVLFIK